MCLVSVLVDSFLLHEQRLTIQEHSLIDLIVIRDNCGDDGSFKGGSYYPEKLQLLLEHAG
jgi:hypothetical protein